MGGGGGGGGEGLVLGEKREGVRGRARARREKRVEEKNFAPRELRSLGPSQS